MDPIIDTYPVNFKFRPHTIFHDFQMRRAGLLKALTTEQEDLAYECNPGRPSLCLYGLPDATWRVEQPPMVVPHELPEPQPNINIYRDKMDRKSWLKQIAIHSDAWLVSIAFNYALRSQFDQISREELFDLINRLPLLITEVTDYHNRCDKKTEAINLILSEKRKGRVDGLCEVCEASGSTSEVTWLMCDKCKHAFHDKCLSYHIRKCHRL